MDCEKITYYIEKGHLTRLNISERLQVKLHKMICNCCKNYAPDSLAVNEILRLLAEEDNTPAFSEEEKQRLKEALQNLK